jgi:hypothetical protein
VLYGRCHNSFLRSRADRLSIHDHALSLQRETIGALYSSKKQKSSCVLYRQQFIMRIMPRSKISGSAGKMHRATVWTVGHSTRTLSNFIALLQAHGIRRLVDVRTIPRSRHNPQFNQDLLPEPLMQAKIQYLHCPGLGGLRHARPDSVNTAWRNASFRGYADYMQSAEFEAALEELMRLARSRRTAIMCAEAVPWRCHRSLIADALLVRGLHVEEIASETSTRPHTLTPWSRVVGERITYPLVPVHPDPKGG